MPPKELEVLYFLAWHQNRVFTREPLLEQVPENCDEYAEAYRLRKFLSYFSSIDHSVLPPTSLLREFLGGSSFTY